MIVKLKSAVLNGLESSIIDIEVDMSRGLPNLIIVGMPDTAIRESRERVRSAIQSLQYKFPNQRIVVNLAPASLKKEGALYDLAIALGILTVSHQISLKGLEKYGFVGELSLDGSLKSVRGILSLLISMKKEGLSKVIVPYENIEEASLVKEIEIYPVKNLKESIALFLDEDHNKKTETHYSSPAIPQQESKSNSIDFREVKGQYFLKRALEIAASGFHNLLMIGPPGSGKSMLAKRFPTILPTMTVEESLECTKIQSVMGLLSEKKLVSAPPFRSPHHTISYVGLLGGGKNLHPGEITLAHNGVLFLDELPEFQRSVLEGLRQPLENNLINIARASGSRTFPACFILIGAMNPCPCGFLTDKKKKCQCSSSQIERYRSKISGPLLDRIDIHVEISSVEFEHMISPIQEESSELIRLRVSQTRQRQAERLKLSLNKVNSRMGGDDLKKYCILEKNTQKILKQIFGDMGFSARAYSKILKVARTIADMDASENIESKHLLEACQYRALDRIFSYDMA